ncbi:MAG: hypothetical protein SGILL_005179, partial [Bacillariaceae sp.]
EKKKTSTKAKKKERRVQFIEQAEMQEEEAPAAELLVEQKENGLSVLSLCPRAGSSSVPDVSDDDEEGGNLLASFDLPNTQIELHHEESSSLTSCRLLAGISIQVLWRHYGLSTTANTSTADTESNILDDLVKCVLKGMLHAILTTSTTNNKASSSITLDFVLTPQALQSCLTLPLVQHPNQRSKFDLANTLQRVIKALFGIFKRAPSGSADQQCAQDITAKQVYKVMDNTQIDKFVTNQQAYPTLDIPDLVPTLRPYQAAAVQWMLQRESAPEHGDEWKTLWMALDVATKKAKPLFDYDVEDTKKTLFYCPFNGWIVTSVKEAEKLVLGDRMHPVRGGCLAEQMGLGKTVELLACILAHPMPTPEPKTTLVDPTCRRRLDFVEKEKDVVINDNCVVAAMGEQPNVGIVNDTSEFADDESSDEEMGNDVAMPVATEGERVSTAPVVTPEKKQDPIHERWVDEVEVGGCICGEIISFPQGARKQKSMVVLCTLCDEPMHLECSCLDINTADRSDRINLRRTFGNETLECILTKTCPCCAVSQKPIESRATVIVCPPAILDQWAREIERHTRKENGQALKVLVYDGVKKISNEAKCRKDKIMRLLHPHYLANTDVILMPFNALMSDLSHSDDNKYVMGGQKRKRYRVVPTPLLSIHFWRVAIDEAQRVEVTTTKAAQMALKLKADNFWAVSGTPIGHGKLQDLYGIFLLLRLAPFDDKHWFKSCLGSMIDGVGDRVQVLLSQCVWRSTKASSTIKRQLGIPEMTENRVLLKFSSIEKHFYANQLEATLLLAGNTNATSGKRKAVELTHLSESMQRLRAACCHPQVGTHGITGGRLKRRQNSRTGDNSVATRVMTMETILETLIDQARLKCEEAQRGMFFIFVRASCVRVLI